MNISYLIALEGKKALGLLSDSDIVAKVVAEGKDSQQILLKDIMTVTTQVTRNETVDYCLEKLIENKIPVLPVVDDKKEFIRVVTLTDCLGTGLLFDLSEENLILNLPLNFKE